MQGTVAHFMQLLERLAPRRLAESWDNVGLQIGGRDWPVATVWTALDPLPELVARACENGVDLLVTHHPLFFKPIKSLDCDTPAGKIARIALSNQLAIYSAHTNLDSVAGGVNDVLVKHMELTGSEALDGGVELDMRKLVVFVPPAHVEPILDTLFDLDAGRIGNYRGCSFRCDGIGTFMPGSDASPAVGHRGQRNDVPETRIEILVAGRDLEAVVAAVRNVHPYETMAYDVYPLSLHDRLTGLGRVGDLASPATLDAFAAHLKAVLGLPAVKVTGDGKQLVTRVAVCSGSGGSLLPSAVAAGADVYVSGDLSYHTARDAQQAGIGLIDVGHFGSERVIVDVFAGAIRDAAAAAGLTVKVEAADTESDPFHYL